MRTFVAKADSAPRTIELTGNMAAFDSTLFARPGYIKIRNADIGTRKKGDVLAVIAAPDLDQQLEQAKGQLVQFQAAVQQAESQRDLGRVTDQRTARVAEGWSSAQQGDTDRLTLAARQAAVERKGQCGVAARRGGPAAATHEFERPPNPSMAS